MALGQNDSHPIDYINKDKEKREHWKSKYKEIILDLRSKYPNALFIIITTLLFSTLYSKILFNPVNTKLMSAKMEFFSRLSK